MLDCHSYQICYSLEIKLLLLLLLLFLLLLLCVSVCNLFFLVLTYTCTLLEDDLMLNICRTSQFKRWMLYLQIFAVFTIVPSSYSVGRCILVA